jgi:uncharacterized membrane protein YbaN (DUF454 family)
VTEAPVDRSSAVRAGWLVGGLACVALGGVGVVVPGFPTTVFFIGAAACFSKSSPRLEAWVLNLRGIGPMVRDHRAGLGMPRRAKVIASACIVGFSGVALWFVLDHLAVRAVVSLAAATGVLYLWWRVPTREVVLAQRAAT